MCISVDEIVAGMLKLHLHTRWEDNFRIDLRENGERMWTEFIWLWIEICFYASMIHCLYSFSS
jgi:hypothetical protein